MMEAVITVAGAIQLTRWVLTLLDAIEKPSVSSPTKARDTESHNHHPPKGGWYGYCISLPPIKQGGK